MRSLLLVLTTLPLASFALTINHLVGRAENSTQNNGPPSSEYSLQRKHAGNTFFNGWDFFSNSDPTHGNVVYQTRENSRDLAYVDDDGCAVLRVDNRGNVPPGGNRRSVRISSQARYNGGLFIADFRQFAYGPSVWPAFWAVGPSWPEGGEVDVVEYVNTDRSNQYTLHTGSAVCRMDPGANFDGNPLGTECRSGAGNNAGCAIKDFDGTAGSPFNAEGGGVFVMLWDETQLSFWRFARGEVPQDIQDECPDPDSWGTPVAHWTDESCDIQNAFRDMQLVINITICGDWAGPAYDNGGFPGTCADAVADPSNYNNALIRIGSISVYQRA